MEMDDPESGATRHGMKKTKRPDDTFFVLNYSIIAVLNLVQFSLTTYGRHKLDTDYDHDDDLISNWDALKFCLAVACLTWVALLYGIIRRFSKYDFFPCFTMRKDWDQVVVQAIIWILQLSAAATQTAFVNDYFHCVVACDYLNRGSHDRNVAYAVFAWLLWLAWTPQLFWSLWDSRRR